MSIERYYLYPLEQLQIRIKWDYDKFFFSRWLKEAYGALLNNSQRTDDPKEANFFVIPFTLACLSFVGFNMEEIEYKFSQLPFWDNGKNHVVFDFTDAPSTIYRNTNLIVCKSAFSTDHYNSKIHISIPQFPRYCFTEDFIKEYKLLKLFPSKLISFKGHPRAGHNLIRDQLFTMNDDKELFIKPFSNNPNDFEFTLENNTMQINPSDDEYSYLNLLFTSRFSLLPRGNGFALSYRSYECWIHSSNNI